MAEQGKKAFDLQKYVNLVNEIITELGVNPDEVFDKEKNMWYLRKGDADVYIELFNIEDNWYVDIRSPIYQVPTANTQSFYLKLLELNHYNIAVKFSVDQGWAWLSVNRELEGISKEELSANLWRVGNMADDWNDKFKEEFPPA
ncbi:MAG: YbjN domain-containing protein [bacterium]